MDDDTQRDEREPAKTQFEIALRRLEQQGCGADPESPVGAFSSAF